jgi:hypothetical protein
MKRMLLAFLLLSGTAWADCPVSRVQITQRTRPEAVYFVAVYRSGVEFVDPNACPSDAGPTWSVCEIDGTDCLDVDFYQQKDRIGSHIRILKVDQRPGRFLVTLTMVSDGKTRRAQRVLWLDAE